MKEVWAWADNVRCGLTALLTHLGFHFLNNQKSQRKQKNQMFHFCKLSSFQVQIQVNLSVLGSDLRSCTWVSALSLWSETRRLLQFSRTRSGPWAASPPWFSREEDGSRTVSQAASACESFTEMLNKQELWSVFVSLELKAAVYSSLCSGCNCLMCVSK